VDGAVRITDARHMAGMETGKCGSLLQKKGACAVIGPAAENGVLFSSVMVDGHFASGRNGLGAVFAHKHLKYITITGTGKTRVFDPGGLKTAREDVLRLVSASPILSGPYGISRFGTGALYDLMDAAKLMPTANFQKTRFSHASKMNAHAYSKAYDPTDAGCKGCHIRCKKISRSGDAIPEFETMSHFSALLENHDMETVMTANSICNETGMDTISAAVTLACHAEIRGAPLSESEIIGLLTDIAWKKGLGEALGKGSARYASSMGRPEDSISVKGQELPAYDPRGAYGMALAYAVSTRGACHLRAYPTSHEILRKPVPTDRFSFAGKARIIKIAEDLNAVADSLTACKFIFFGASLEEYAKIYTAVTGIEASGRDLSLIGERICVNERAMNSKAGFGLDDDDLPPRFFNSAGDQEGVLLIPPIDRNAFLQAKNNYYKVRGLDENGAPLPRTMERLGL